MLDLTDSEGEFNSVKTNRDGMRYKKRKRRRVSVNCELQSEQTRGEGVCAEGDKVALPPVYHPALTKKINSSVNSKQIKLDLKSADWTG